MEQIRDLRLAVLIDADNVPYSNIKEMLEEIAKYGTPTFKRIYADWTKPTVSGWKGVLLESAIITGHHPPAAGAWCAQRPARRARPDGAGHGAPGRPPGSRGLVRRALARREQAACCSGCLRHRSRACRCGAGMRVGQARARPGSSTGGWRWAKRCLRECARLGRVIGSGGHQVQLKSNGGGCGCGIHHYAALADGSFSRNQR